MTITAYMMLGDIKSCLRCYENCQIGAFYGIYFKTI
jgi:hypothetical protein